MSSPLTPPGYQQGGTYTALLDRMYITTVQNVRDYTQTFRERGGFFPSRVPTYSNPSAMNVSISACAGLVANNFASNAGGYKFAAPASMAAVLAASSATLNRIDTVGIQIKDNFYDSSGLNTAVIAVVQGTAVAGSPTAPALPNGFLPVVDWTISANATTPSSPVSRIQFSVGEGAPLPVANATERNALGTPPAGTLIWRRDRAWLEYYDGSAWRVSGVAVCTTTADRDGASGVTAPYAGLLAYCTSTSEMYEYDGGGWLPFRALGGRLVTTAVAGALGSTSAGTELDIAKLQISGVRIRSGHWYVFHINISAQLSVVGDTFQVIVRNTTALTGTRRVDAEWQGTAGGATHSKSIEMMWQAPADDLSAAFFVSIQRIAGTGIAAINGLSRTSFYIEHKGNDTAVWAAVA